MKKLIFLFLFIFTQLAWGANNIAAIVNQEVITISDLFNRINLVIQVNNMPQNNETVEFLMPKVLNMLIDEKLVNKAAKDAQIKLEEFDIQNAINELEKQNNILPGQLKTFLANKNIDYDEAMKQTKNQLLWQKLLKMHFAPSITVADDDVELFQHQLPKFGNHEELVSGIFTRRVNMQAQNYLNKLRREAVIEIKLQK